MMKGYTYILRCKDDTLYCGWTNNLTARLYAHNSGKGAKYTKGRSPVSLAYSELYDNKSEAMKREAYIKSLSRAEKEKLIAGQSGGEYLTVYDSGGNPCGERPRAIIHQQGLFHHVSHLWLLGEWNGDFGLWLQQRAENRPLYPGHFDLTATGHIDPGETPLMGTIREAAEEAGLSLSESDLTYGGAFHQLYPRDNDAGLDNELAHAYLCRMDGIPSFQIGEEVKQMVFVSIKAFDQAHENMAEITARAADSAIIKIAHDKLCCLHDKEWKEIRALLPSHLFL